MNINELRQIASQQRVLLYLVLFQLLFFCMQDVKFDHIEKVQLLTYLIFACFQAFFVRKLAIKLYSYREGAALGILALIPWVSLVILLIVNTKTTESLKRNGIRVGFMGAKDF